MRHRSTSLRSAAAVVFAIGLGFGAASAGPQVSRGTIAGIVAGGGSWTCTISRVTGEDRMQGTIHVGGGKMRGDFTSQTAKGPIDSHMISDGTTIYVWTSARPQGIKMAIPAASNAAPAGNSQANLYNQNVDYTCAPWTVDAAEFVLPTGIAFTDLSAMMGAAKGAGTMGAPGAPALNCGLCDQAPKGPARDKCRAAMHCQ